MKFIDNSWNDWIEYYLRQNCDKAKLFEILLKEGFPSDWILQRINTNYSIPKNIEQCNKAIVTKHAKRYPSTYIELYTIDNFMTSFECKRLIEIAKPHVVKSTITNNDKEQDKKFRTSKTTHFQYIQKEEEKNFIKRMDEKICDALHLDISFSESTQLQSYQVGNEFKAHTDYFEKGTSSYKQHASRYGNRTWTFMVYLNDVERGGGTFFSKLNKRFYPKQGMAILWNNLYPNGTVNPDTLHAGEPILKGEKNIITKWFREKSK